MKKTRGFTLAEVLITLGIIGIVAAMTIPTLIANYQKTQYVAQLKKAYSTINEALTKMTNDVGCTGNLACTGYFSTGTTSATFGQELTKYIKAAKVCGMAPNSECWPTKTYSRYNGSAPSSYTNYGNISGIYSFTTIDGASIAIESWTRYGLPDCTRSGSNNITNNLKQDCATITIDINGLKEPNAKGRDTFNFHVSNGKGAILYPYGGQDDNYGTWLGSPDNACGKYGADQCAGRIMEEDWQMNY